MKKEENVFVSRPTIQNANIIRKADGTKVIRTSSGVVVQAPAKGGKLK